MINQMKTGKFIAAKRKEKNLTQKQLAEILEISDKTISKWECGKGMPDNSIILELCRELEINVNELLSGEQLADENYPGKAEENMVGLMKENQRQEKAGKWTIFGSVTGLLFLLIGLFNLGFGLVWNFENFIDVVSVSELLGITFLVLVFAGAFEDFIKSFKDAFTKKTQTEDQIRKRIQAVTLAISANIFSSIFLFIMTVIIILKTLVDLSSLGPNMAVAVLTFFYAMLFNLILLVIKGRLQRKIYSLT